jgi:beta-lactamase superfamily II metal-dependent hydrolase
MTLLAQTPRRTFFLLALLLGFAIAGLPRAWAAKGVLRAYIIDVEGGQSTLFVTPAGQSLLIDTGWSDNQGRDANRIVAAAKDAGLSKINYVLLTHYHVDHSGGVPQLVERIPVGTFIDHGPNTETKPGVTEQVWEAYQKVLATGKYKHIVARPGEVLPIRGMKVTVISSNGDVIDHSLPGGGETNKYCNIPETKPMDRSENSRSLGIFIDFRRLKILDLGDLTWDKEMQFMCPVNRLGKVDILIVSHHGMTPSSSHALVDAIQARVAIMDNGETKGGMPQVIDTIQHAPGLETLWQLHYSAKGGAEHNTAAEYIANPQGTEAGNYFLLTASPKGSFKIFNSRTKQTKSYPAK